MSDDVTPIRQQYLEIKRQYPDSIVFFRLGDFYETFDHDAEITSRELDIVLTSRPVSKGKRIPMAGIPFHAVDNYLARLIDKGYHVAICEQVGDQPARGLFARQVTRVVTPGTVVEPGLLQGDRNNYLVSLVLTEERAGIAFVDITTGEFSAAEIVDADLMASIRGELLRLRPAEILLPENTDLPDNISGHLTRWPAWHFEPSRCQDALLGHFKVAVLDGFGLRGLTQAVRAAGAILQYLEDTQPAALNLLTVLTTYSLGEFMTLDASTRRNLELTETIRGGDVQGSLLSVVDHSVSPMGKRLVRQWVSKPLLEIQAIQKRLDSVAVLLQDGILRAELRASLRSLADLERLTNRIASGHAQPHDLTAVRQSLRILPRILALFTDSGQVRALQDTLACLDPCADELGLLENSIADDPPATLQNTGIIRPSFSAELDNVIEASRHAREWIANFESVERERTGIKTLKVGYNKVFGYYIEVSRGAAGNVPPEYIRKQTLVNNERFITPEMKEYEALVLNAEERIHDIEINLFKAVCAQLTQASGRLLATARSLAQLDVLASLAEAAARNNYTCPLVTEDTLLEIIDGRHPVVEQTLRGERFVPNDAIFEPGELVRIITGPNMSGKSTFLRQVALIVLMAQMGSFVPASSARIGLVDRIFTRIGAQDEIFAGQSTFMVEMTEASNILNHATNRSLLVLDEIGRGTSTYDGLSIAWAVVEYIHNHPRLRSRTLFATHYHELTQLSDLLPGIRNYNVAVSESEGHVVFLHKIVPGGTDRSYGIHVAQLAGMPNPIIQRASEILLQLEASSGKAIKINPNLPQQMALFPETNPLLDELKSLDMNALSPIEALNLLYEWQRKFLEKNPKR
ncbi:MAG TPA: DNA mismatch repair protein MutS [Anaerolineaceae bacterium]|nr:DNA mismatch repair protein MutS [Anaerolineaceae bacterium]